MTNKNLKIGLIVGTLFFLASASSAWADKPGTLGIGIGGGTVTNGLSGKYYMSPLAIQANLGSVGGGSDRADFGGFGVSADALFEGPSLFRNSVVSIDWNIGLGAGIGFRNDLTLLAVAGVAGIEFNFVPVPIDLVLEYRPTLAVSPDVDLDLVDFSGHLRFYFM